MVVTNLNFKDSSNVSALDYLWCYRLARIKRYADKFYDLLEVQRTIGNWQEAMLFRFGMKKEFVMRLRDGRSMKIDKVADYFNFWTLQKWDWLNPKNRVIVDVGAWDGDTAIYFALNGARHVYAFEPYPYSYRIAKRNVAEAGLSGKITMVNEGCGKSDTILIDGRYRNKVTSSLEDFRKGKKIRIRSLAEIRDKYRIKNGLLKIDCEGHEYELLLGADSKALRSFERIILGYHHGYKNLARKLRGNGFAVKYKLPLYDENLRIGTGLMYAERLRGR